MALALLQLEVLDDIRETFGKMQDRLIRLAEQQGPGALWVRFTENEIDAMARRGACSRCMVMAGEQETAVELGGGRSALQTCHDPAVGACYGGSGRCRGEREARR
jgi:hypothetical protein